MDTNHINSSKINDMELEIINLKIKLKDKNEEIIIMHPGPINRGVEIDSVVADSDQAIILDQVLNGVASRMAILYLFCGESPGKDTK